MFDDFQPDWIYTDEQKAMIEAKQAFVWGYHLIHYNRVFCEVKRYMAHGEIRRAKKGINNNE